MTNLQGVISRKMEKHIAGLEANVNWTISNYRLNKLYNSHAICLTDLIHCYVQVAPDHLFGTKRAFFNIFFTKLPSKCDAEYQYVVYARNTRSVVAYQNFRRISCQNNGYRADRNYITQHNFNDFLDNNGSLDLRFEFFIKDPKNIKSWNLRNFSAPPTKLADCLNNIFLANKCTNIDLICAKKEIVKANKVILAARSPVFAKVLTDETDTYDMSPEFSSQAVSEFLRFLYTDSIHMKTFDKFSVQLLQLADKYQVPEFLKLCREDMSVGSRIKIKTVFNRFLDTPIERIRDSRNLSEVMEHIKALEELIMYL